MSTTTRSAPPLWAPAALLGQGHRLGQVAARPQVVAQVVRGAAEAGGGGDRAEAAQRLVPLLAAPVLLLQTLIHLDQLRAHTNAPIVITTRCPRAWFADHAARGYAGVLTEPFDLPELVRLARSLAPLPD